MASYKAVAAFYTNLAFYADSFVFTVGVTPAPDSPLEKKIQEHGLTGQALTVHIIIFGIQDPILIIL